MDAEEERSAHKVLDPMVPCRQNGRIGKTGAAVLFFFFFFKYLLCVLLSSV